MAVLCDLCWVSVLWCLVIDLTLCAVAVINTSTQRCMTYKHGYENLQALTHL